MGDREVKVMKRKTKGAQTANLDKDTNYDIIDINTCVINFTSPLFWLMSTFFLLAFSFSTSADTNLSRLLIRVSSLRSPSGDQNNREF